MIKSSEELILEQYMKKLILLSAIFGFSLFAKAQCTLPYKSLAAFNNDTTAFVKYNFSDRAACYVGKTLKDVIQDLGIPIQSFLRIVYGRNGDLYIGMYIYIYPFQAIMQFICKHKYPNFIAITWMTPVSVNVFDALEDTTDRYKWTPQVANYVMNMPIKEIGIVQ